MVEEGKIAYMHIYGSLFTLQEEFRRTTINNYYRSVAEYSAPFQDKSSPVYQAGLRLVSIDTKVVHCPYNEKWVKEGKKGQQQLSIFFLMAFVSYASFQYFITLMFLILRALIVFSTFHQNYLNVSELSHWIGISYYCSIHFGIVTS